MIERYLKIAAVAFVATGGLLAYDASSGADAQVGSARGTVRTSQPASSQTDERLVIQRLLAANGFAVGEINGELTDETREAIRSFQRQNFMRVDGRVTLSLMTFLAAHALDLLPGGDAEDILTADTSDNGTRDLQSRATVSLVQRILARHGFEPGRIDGLMGPVTRRAIRNFQSQVGLEITGDIDDSFLTTLGEFVEVNREFSTASR